MERTAPDQGALVRVGGPHITEYADEPPNWSSTAPASCFLGGHPSKKTKASPSFSMARQEGLEPPSNCLEGSRSRHRMNTHLDNVVQFCSTAGCLGPLPERSALATMRDLGAQPVAGGIRLVQFLVQFRRDRRAQTGMN